MSFSSNSIYDTYVRTVSEVNAPHISYKGYIWIGSNAVQVTKILDMSSVMDFNEGKSNMFYITVTLPKTIVRDVIMPYKKHLLFQLRSSPISPTSPIEILNKNYSRIYTAFLTDPTNPSIISNVSTANDKKKDDDLGDLAEITLELVETAYLHYRSIQVGGIIRYPGDMSIDILLKGMMTRTLSDKSLTESTVSVTIAQADNKRVYPQMVIKQGTLLRDLPDVWQQKYGIYATDISSFFLDNRWYIFPLLDTTRFDKENDKLTILIMPSDKFSGQENSWIIEPSGNCIILATGSVEFIDDSDKYQMTDGNAIRYAKGSTAANGFYLLDGNQPYIEKELNRKDFVVDKRPNSIQHYMTSDTLLTDNPWNMVSVISRGLCALVSLTWENSEHRLLTPGMPVKIIYKDKGKIISVKGTLVHTATVTRAVTGNPGDVRFRSVSQLTVLVHRNIADEVDE